MRVLVICFVDIEGSHMEPEANITPTYVEKIGTLSHVPIRFVALSVIEIRHFEIL